MHKNLEGEEYKTPYAVICDSHGVQRISEMQYQAALMYENIPWKCPICKQIAEWDEACPASNPPNPF
jgi:hypothetical protein